MFSVSKDNLFDIYCIEVYSLLNLFQMIGACLSMSARAYRDLVFGFSCVLVSHRHRGLCYFHHSVLNIYVFYCDVTKM